MLKVLTKIGPQAVNVKSAKTNRYFLKQSMLKVLTKIGPHAVNVKSANKNRSLSNLASETVDFGRFLELLARSI